MRINEPLLSKDNLTISGETASIVNDWIILREKRKDQPTRKHLDIAESFLARTLGASDFPDFCFHKSEKYEGLKLKGGSRVKNFDTEEEEIVKVLTLFRSLDVFGEFEDHKICKISSKNPKESLCYFCLMMSTVFKCRVGKGRQQ